MSTGREHARHIILIGLPGSGKTTVGRLLAERLSRPFIDLDEVIASEAGLGIPEIFARHGEPHFRALERAAMAAALQAPPAVIAPGGGWAAQSGGLDSVRTQAWTVHLDVAPETVARRLAGDRSRPLLAGDDPLGAIRRLRSLRERDYGRADLTVEAGVGSPGEIADLIVARLKVSD